ncbi:hypothetical protein FRC02_008197 [Tulasnella sp. 418]|nr:hypothetical protein FRC02_008197 [Tulasnella sp. 418]
MSQSMSATQTHTLDDGKGHFRLLDFPTELIINILKRCFARDVLNIRVACRRLYWITQEKQLWRNILCQLYFSRNILPPPMQHLSGLDSKKLELMARGPLQLENSWKDCTLWDAPKATVVGITRVKTHEHVEHDAGIWSLVPGGRWLFHMFEFEDRPGVMVRLLDVDAAFDDVIELLSTCIGPPLPHDTGPQVRVGPYTAAPNYFGDGMLTAISMCNPGAPWVITISEVMFPRWTPHRPQRRFEDMYEDTDSLRAQMPRAAYYERNTLAIHWKPLEILIDPANYIAIVFEASQGCIGVVFWRWFHARPKGQPAVTATMLTDVPYSDEVSFSFVGDYFVITNPLEQVVWGYFKPHRARSDQTTPANFIQRFGGLEEIDIRTFNLRFSNMWGASDHDQLLFATTNDTLYADKIYQYWIDKRTLALSALVHPIPLDMIEPEFRESGVKLLSCHVGQTHNTMILGTAGGLYAMRRLNPRYHRQQCYGYASNIVSLSPLYTKEMFGVANSDNIIRDWNNRHDLLASVDEVTGRVAIGMFDSFPGTLTLLDFTK